jgi:predicted RNA-binding Zn ribbon-like protein
MNARERLESVRNRMPDLVVGGALCLDFANTVEPRGGLKPVSQSDRQQAHWRDYLHDYCDFVLWALYVNAVPEDVAMELLRRIDRRPDEAAELFARAIALREAIYVIFWRLAHDEAVASSDLALVEQEYCAALAGAHLSSVNDRFQWTWPKYATLDRPLQLIAVSAVELLLNGDRERIKSCPGVEGFPMTCAWLFYDTSKNRGRHWCSMDDCGGVTKARRLTARRRAQRRQTPTSDYPIP